MSSISLRPETHKLIEERLKQGVFSTPDDMIRVALDTLDQCDVDDLDDATLAAIDRAEAEYERGEGIPADVAFAQLRRKHFGD
jgi:Arc/MetJ-type ribon-helix-helix transcriptional regulator